MSLVGIGYDSHRLVRGRRLVIGGVQLQSEFGLEGHSDADVLAHALIDALLGAAGLGDIGEHFPDTDERYKDIDSMVLLAEALAAVAGTGLRVGNVDCTVLLERPKLGTYRERVRERLATALGLPLERVNVKASTGEGIGFIGRGEGIAALALATLERAG
jgi:2-C-methyl-D-erythritol 2,4-cyclodiphosphate synthase